MDIQFYWSGSFVGTSYYFVVDGELNTIPGFPSSENAKYGILLVLQKKYNLEYKMDDIHFQWDGKL